MPSHHAPLFLGAAPEEAKVHCVFVHGRTQSPEDMREQVVGKLKTAGVAFILPRAAGNSWYAARATDPLSAETRGQLGQSLDYLHGIVAGLPRAAGVPLVVGGFSQGACLTLEYAMRHGPWHGAMVNLTGCRVGTAGCDRPFADLDCMPVYLTGSDKDPWIPVGAFARAAEELARARATLRCDVFPDRAHQVGEAEISAFDEMLSSLANRH